MTGAVSLRDVSEDDLPIFFEYQCDPTASYMAAFTAKDPTDWDAFTEHWGGIMDDATIVKQTILYDGQVAGYIVCFEWLGKPETGYWIGREYWGKGIATQALLQFLGIIEIRPLYAAAAKDNLASIRVLEKCGFTITGYEKSFANARGKEIEEVMLVLN